tara:strand:- start:1141 stop:1908 length:768 start_codon:yes stop_codon:yes gene_type:complete
MKSVMKAQQIKGRELMKGNHRWLYTLPLFVLALLTGCATVQPPVAMDQVFWTEKHESIGVMVADLPAPTVVMIGQQGLLDYAVNSAVASGLRSKVETWDASGFNELSAVVTEQLRSHGYKVKQIQETLDAAELMQPKSGKVGFSPVDLRSIKAKHNVDKLVLFIPTAFGTVRSYYSVVPTSDPIVQVGVNSYVVDLDDNRFLYYQGQVVNRAAEGEWDEGPEYPNLTNAFYQALDSAQQSALTPFKTQQVSTNTP